MAKKSKDNKAVAAAALAGGRISLGLIFLWAFFDKLLGLGFTTCRDNSGAIETLCQKAWASGGSPTNGFLQFGTSGPFEGLFQSLAGVAVVDWLFMAGLLGIGIGLTLGIAKKLSSYAGALLLLMMWLAVLPPEHHPVVDDHIVYALVLVFLANSPDTKWSLNKWFSTTPLGKHLK